MKIRSYDIFDTCLVRSCGRPEQIFDILALEILGKNATKSDLNDFALIRANAEKAAKQKLSKSQVTIKEIYDLCNFSLLTDINNNDILNKELEIEYINLLGVTSLRDKISRERSNGYKIVYISDMYLPSTFIKSVLSKEGFWTEIDELYVSCEYGKSKRDENLFREIKKIHSDNLEAWTHHGDNVESDVTVPKRLGIKSVHIDNPYSYYQKNILDNPNRYNGHIATRMAGVSRAVVHKYKKDAACLIAADLIAPVFVPFVYNILSEAKRKSIKSLYFLARDGQILYDIAVGLKKLFPEINLHYLCVSRKTIYFPALKSYDDIEGIIDKKRTSKLHPLDVIYNYTGVKFESSEIGSNKSLHEILKIPKVRQTLENIQKVKRNQILKYFRQEGIAAKDDGNKAIVDLRGTAKSLAYINDILTEGGYDDVYGFYFEVTKDRISTKRRIEYYSELDAGNYEWSDKRLMDLYAVLESYFCASNHGRTIEYCDKDSNITPVFEDEPNQLYITKIYSENKNIVESWVKYYINNYIFMFNNEALNLGLSNLKSFAIYPHHEYLYPLTKFNFSSTGIERDSIVRKLSLLEMATLKFREDSLSWFIGCVAWTFGKSGKWVISIVKSAKGFFRTVFRIYN